MSAYMLTSSELRFLALALTKRNPGFHQAQKANLLMRELFDMNRAATTERYGKSEILVCLLPEITTEEVIDFRQPSAGVLAMKMHEYMYQCCGSDGWAGSAVCNRFYSEFSGLCRSLPDYEV